MAEPEKPRILELNRFSLFAPCPGVEGRMSRLAWCIRDGYPRISVYLNNPSVTGYAGILYAPFNPTTFFVFLDELEKIAKGESGNKCKFSNYTHPRENGVVIPNSEKILQSELWIGKDNDGICWISVVMPDRPKIKFEFHLSPYHKVTRSDGTELSKSDGSVLETLAVALAIRDVYLRLTTELRQPMPTTSSTRSTYTPKGSSAAKETTKVPADDMFEDDIGF